MFLYVAMNMLTKYHGLLLAGLRLSQPLSSYSLWSFVLSPIWLHEDSNFNVLYAPLWLSLKVFKAAQYSFLMHCYKALLTVFWFIDFSL